MIEGISLVIAGVSLLVLPRAYEVYGIKHISGAGGLACPASWFAMLSAIGIYFLSALFLTYFVF